MEKHMELTDAEFEAQFRNCEFEAGQFSHEAHIRLAWIHIRKYGPAQAEENIQKQLRAFTEHLGETEKYHLTVTVAAVRIVAHFASQSKSNAFKDFIAEFPRLKTDFKALLQQHYGFDIFASDLARSTFIEPDLLAF